MRAALYYPHTTVENLNLIKTALLLWDELAYIVPWENFEVEYEDPLVARAIELIGKQHVPANAEKKEAHKRIEELLSEELPPRFYFDDYLRRNPDKIYEIYPQKFLSETWDLLEESRFATKFIRHGDAGTSYPGGLLVMSILADCCAGNERSRVTDRSDAYATIASLLQGRSLERPIENSQQILAPISLKVIDSPSLSLKRLIKFREREALESGHTLRALRHRYLAGLDTYMKRLSTEKIQPADVEEIKRQFADDMSDDLHNLRKELKFARADAILSKDILVTLLAGVGTAAGWLMGAPVPLIGGAGASLTVGGVLSAGNRYLSARHAVMQKHPMAYLYEFNR